MPPGNKNLHTTTRFDSAGSYIQLLSPAAKLQQGNVFTPVCHSVHRGACVPLMPPCHACPLTHTHPAMHAPCHTHPSATHTPAMHPLPCMPPAMHTPCHACPLPHMPPAMHPHAMHTFPPYHACPIPGHAWSPTMHAQPPHTHPCHACPPAMHAPLPCTPPAMHPSCHAHLPAMHTPLPCMPLAMHAPLPCTTPCHVCHHDMRSVSGRYASYWNAFLFGVFV